MGVLRAPAKPGLAIGFGGAIGLGGAGLATGALGSFAGGAMRTGPIVPDEVGLIDELLGRPIFTGCEPLPVTLRGVAGGGAVGGFVRG